jgi:hypothetical protein
MNTTGPLLHELANGLEGALVGVHAGDDVDGPCRVAWRPSAVRTVMIQWWRTESVCPAVVGVSVVGVAMGGQSFRVGVVPQVWQAVSAGAL